MKFYLEQIEKGIIASHVESYRLCVALKCFRKAIYNNNNNDNNNNDTFITHHRMKMNYSVFYN